MKIRVILPVLAAVVSLSSCSTDTAQSATIPVAPSPAQTSASAPPSPTPTVPTADASETESPSQSPSPTEETPSEEPSESAPAEEPSASSPAEEPSSVEESSAPAAEDSASPTPSSGASEVAPPAPVDDHTDCTKVKCVAITFDDGPGDRTNEILDVLQQEGARVTFFVMGYKVANNPALVKRMAAEGHQVANHTWNHPDLQTVGQGEVRRQLQRTNDAINDAIGQSGSMIRPPYGSYNPGVKAVAKELANGVLVLWSVDTLDWKTQSTQATIDSALKAKRGDIILMHDIHNATVDAVPQIVKGLKERGFTLVTVEQILAAENPSPGSVHQYGLRGDDTPHP